MFEYVAADIVTRNAAQALVIASARAVESGFTIVGVKRITDKRRGSMKTFTVVLTVQA